MGSAASSLRSAAGELSKKLRSEEAESRLESIKLRKAVDSEPGFLSSPSLLLWIFTHFPGPLSSLDSWQTKLTAE